MVQEESVADEKRRHVRTGRKPPGGRRSPAGGRPFGGPPNGTIAALVARRAALARLGPEADPADLAAVEHCTERVAAVLDGRVHPSMAGVVLKAAAQLLDSTAGQVRQRVEHSGGVSVGVIDPYAVPPALPASAVMPVAVPLVGGGVVVRHCSAPPAPLDDPPVPTAGEEEGDGG